MIDPTYISASCLQHAANPITAYCVRCGRPICDLCTFWVGSAIFCPECLSSGPSADERTAVTVKGVLSIFLALLATPLVGYEAMGTVEPAVYKVVSIALNLAIVATTLGGVSLALIGREGAQRTGSMLPLIGLILSAVVLGLHVIQVVIVTFQGG